ncbi:MAG: exonuclease SbcCD subunit D [Bacteroidia bacterium]
MKILHTADWHLGKKLEQYPRMDEQRAVMDEICRIADREDPDVVLVAGDLYDQINPSVEATELLYLTLKRLADEGRRVVVGIAGNHDAPERIEAPDPLARACGIILTGYPDSEVRPFALAGGLEVLRSDKGFVELKLPRQAVPLRLILTPYANEVRLRKYLGADETLLRETLAAYWQRLADTYCDPQGVNVLMTHLFMVAPGQEAAMEAMEDEGEKPLRSVGGAQQVYTTDLPPGLDYVALGHLHSYIPLQLEPYPAIYSSSPLPYSIDDRQQDKYVVMVEIEPGSPATVRRVPLTSGRKVLRQYFDDVEAAVQWLHDHPGCLVECVVATDRHLTAQDRKRMLDAHDGVLRVVPQFNNPEMLRFTSGKQIDLSHNIEALFAQYFQHKQATPINEELLQLFREVLSEQPEP